MRGLQWSTSLVYLDDVIVIANSIKQMVSRLRSVLYRIEKAGLKLKLSKCHFFQSQGHFFGAVSANGLATAWDDSC